MKEILITSLFEEGHSLAYPYFKDYDYPYEVLPHIKEIVLEIGKGLSLEEYDHPSDDIWIHKSAKIAPNASISGPTIIGKNAEVRVGAFIRGSALIGDNCVVGNSCEVKNAIMSDYAQAPHFNYVGDSILGFHGHMGAGSVLSNFKNDGSNISTTYKGEKIATGLRKFGAILGDYVEVGCNAVVGPGAIIGKHTNIYPTSFVRGFVEEYSIYKSKTDIVKKK